MGVAALKENGNKCSDKGECKSASCRNGICAFPLAKIGEMCEGPDMCESNTCTDFKCVAALKENGNKCSDKGECKSASCRNGICNGENKASADTTCATKCGPGTMQMGSECVGIAGTCAGLWGDKVAHYRPEDVCQCNDKCKAYGNCCMDYQGSKGETC